MRIIDDIFPIKSQDLPGTIPKNTELKPASLLEGLPNIPWKNQTEMVTGAKSFAAQSRWMLVLPTQSWEIGIIIVALLT